MTYLQRRQMLLAGAAAAGLPGGRAWGQAYPGKPLSLVVASPAGGPVDATARVLNPLMQARFGQPVLVVNVPGAGGSIGVQRVADAPADGYTAFLGTPSDTVLAPLAVATAKSRPESLRLVARVSQAEYVVVTRPGLAFKDADAFVARLRAKGEKELSYASFGHGAINHIATEDLLQRLGGAALHVPVAGMAPSITNLIGNQIDFCLMPIAGATIGLMRERKLLPVFVAAARRHPQLPEVLSSEEVAALRGFRLAIWLGLFLPRGAPNDVAQRLNALMAEVVATPEFRKFSDEGGSIVISPVAADAEDQFYQSEIERYRRLAQAMKLEAR